MKKALILIAILVIPSVAYLLIRTGKNNYKQLEYFGPKDLVTRSVNGKSVTDTAYHTVGAFALFDEDSNSVTEAITKDKIYVADFIFTTCKSICPEMSMQMTRVQFKYHNDPTVSILSFTVDPDNDTPSVLKAYGKKHNAQSGKWHFLTGDKEQIYSLARHSYFVTAMEGDGKVDDFVHSEQVVLVDKEKHIRGFYDGTDVNDINKLIEDIRALEMQYLPK